MASSSSSGSVVGAVLALAGIGEVLGVFGPSMLQVLLMHVSVEDVVLVVVVVVMTAAVDMTVEVVVSVVEAVVVDAVDAAVVISLWTHIY